MTYQKLKRKIFVLSVFLSIGCVCASILGCGGGGGGSDSTPSSSSVTLAWDAPTTNVDGTPLSDLVGYRVYYGTSSGEYTDTVDVIDFKTVTIGNLDPGTLFLAVTAFDTSGYESDFSDEISVQID